MTWNSVLFFMCWQKKNFRTSFISLRFLHLSLLIAIFIRVNFVSLLTLEIVDGGLGRCMSDLVA
jgi:hypothetical protein